MGMLPVEATNPILRFVNTDEPPLVESISPDTAEAGAADVTITVTGQGFRESAVITFDGEDQATTWVDYTQVTAVVPTSTAAPDTTITVKVRNEAGADESAGSGTFTVTAPAGGGTLSATTARKRR